MAPPERPPQAPGGARGARDAPGGPQEGPGRPREAFLGLNRAPVEARARFFKKNGASEQTLQLIFTFPHPQFSTKTPRKLDFRNTLHVKPPVAGAKLGPQRQPKSPNYHILGCSRPPGPSRGLQGAFLVHFHFFLVCAETAERRTAQHSTAPQSTATPAKQAKWKYNIPVRRLRSLASRFP